MVGWHVRAHELARDPGVEPLAALAGLPGATSPVLDGVLAPGVLGTGLHGPVLALNPELADLVLARALGASGWAPLPVPAVALARSRRIAELTRQAEHPGRQRPRPARGRRRSA
jgi:CobQ-like glutamine amidotransferase family enzyme